MKNKSFIYYFSAGTVFGIGIMLTVHTLNQPGDIDHYAAKTIPQLYGAADNDNKQDTPPQQFTHSTNATDLILSNDNLNAYSEQQAAQHNAFLESIKKEVIETISRELQQNTEISHTNNNLNSDSYADSEKNYEQAKLTLQYAIENQTLTLHQLASEPNISTLPKPLRDKIMGEAAMQINSGQLDPEFFFEKKLP